MPLPEPDPREIERGLTELEHYVQAQATPSVAPEADTARVRRLRREVAEARALVRLQADAAPLLVESRRVRRRRLAVVEAARLHALAQDSAAVAWQAARWRRVLTAVGVSALVAGLAWSTAGVHATAAAGTGPRDIAWWLAWLVEPCISAIVLMIVGARGYLASRGRPLKSKLLTRIEAGALGMTLLLNTWPYLPGVAQEYSTVRLLVHMVGPLVAAAAVASLTVIWAALAALPAGPAPEVLTGALTPLTYRADAAGTSAVGVATAPAEPVPAGHAPSQDVAALVARVRDLIEAGELPADPSANRIRAALRCGMDTARMVRDALGGDR